MTKTNYELRYAAHPDDARHYPTERLRHDFLIEKIFAPDEVNMVYSMYDRMIVGGAMPVVEKLHLEAIDPLKQPIFLHSRELGIFNVGGDGKVYVADKYFELTYKEALYLGAGDREVYFESLDPQNPAKFYFNSATAIVIILTESYEVGCVVMEMGRARNFNHRNINRLLVYQVLHTMPVTDGNGPNSPREAFVEHNATTYTFKADGSLFLFRRSANQAVCHFMGSGSETRNIWLTKRDRRYFLHNGRYMQQPEPPIILLFGGWRAKISITMIRIFRKLQKSDKNNNKNISSYGKF
jgi:4-deoxy-L-threo-5-hexosulose-uronate ketol-isomerase